MIAETKRMTRMTMVQSVGRSSVRTAIEPVHMSTKITTEMIMIGAWGAIQYIWNLRLVLVKLRQSLRTHLERCFLAVG